IGRPMTLKRAAGTFGCFVIALLSKEQGMLVPLMVGACVVLGVRKREPGEERIMRWLMLAMCWALAAYIAGRELSSVKFSWHGARVRDGEQSADPDRDAHGGMADVSAQRILLLPGGVGAGSA